MLVSSSRLLRAVLCSAAQSPVFRSAQCTHHLLSEKRDLELLDRLHMMARKSVLLIGIAWSEYDALVGPDKRDEMIQMVKKALADGEKQLTDAGFDYSYLEYSTTQGPERLEQVLAEKSYDGVCIGIGIRSNKQYTPLFERLVNIVHQNAPHTKLLFNSTPSNTLEAAQRVLGSRT